MGTFCFGMAEYVLMAILPYMARDFGVSIVEAGRFISAYALGVCFGAPLIAITARRLPLRRILLLLATIYTVAVVGTTFCPTPGGDTSSRWQYYLMLLLRFINGLPHGAYFSVGAIVAERISARGKAAFAIAFMCSGMTLANVIGIPLATYISSNYTWKIVFAFNTLIGMATLYGIRHWIPRLEALPDHGLKSQFLFLTKLAPWLLVLCTMMGNGGIFSWYSYISPTLTDLAGVPDAWMMAMMTLAGLGMFVGNLSGGKLADKFGPGHTGLGIEVCICGGLLLTGLTTQWIGCAIPLMFFCCACLFAVSSPQQLLLIRHSKGGELMGGAMVQIAFNFGNALGAFFGGLPIDEAVPATYHYPAFIGAVMAAVGIVSYWLFCRKYESKG